MIIDLSDPTDYKTKYQIKDHLFQLLDNIPLKEKEEVIRFLILSLNLKITGDIV